MGRRERAAEAAARELADQARATLPKVPTPMELMAAAETKKAPTQEAAAELIVATVNVRVRMPWRQRLGTAWRLLVALLADRVSPLVMETQDVAAGSVAGGAAGPDLAAKQVQRYDVDSVRGVVVFYAKGPLDVVATRVELRYSQLKHVSGQLLQQEAVRDELALRHRGAGTNMA